MTDFTVGQLMPAALHRISTGSGRSPAISRSATLIGTLESAARATTVSSYLPSPANAAKRRLVHAARPMQAQYHALRGAVIARAHACADFMGDFFQDAANFRLLFRRRRGEQPLMHDCGGSRQQFAEQLRRNIGPQSDLLGKNSVALGALDQAEKARSRKCARRDCRRCCAPLRDRRAAPERR